MRLGFVHWVSETPSGGNTFDAGLLAGLRRAGVTVTAMTLRGSLHAGLADRVTEGLRAEPVTLIDGIVAVETPEVIAAAVAAGRRVTVLVHHFGGDAPDLSPLQSREWATRESAVLRNATSVLCTSQWAADELTRRYGLSGVGVARPAVHPAPLARGSAGGSRIVAVGTLTPSKDQLGLVAALGKVSDAAWSARLIGGDTADTGYAAAVRGAIEHAGLAERIGVPGALTGSRLESEWAAADLLVHGSRSETYGMVVTEALAHGVPAIVAGGTGAVEALDVGRREGSEMAGEIVPPGDVAALACVLERWLNDEDVRLRWRAAAIDQRLRLPTWSQTTAAVLAHLGPAGMMGT